MRTLRFLLEKEFRQIFRNPAILRVIFVVPILQLLLLPWAADYEVRNIKLAVIDHASKTIQALRPFSNHTCSPGHSYPGPVIQKTR